MPVFRRCWLLAGLFALLGCSESGPQRAAVSGSVLVDGQPLKEGSIQFIPLEQKGPGEGGVIQDGKYHIARSPKGVLVGKNRVELKAFKKTGRKIQDPTAPPGVMTEEIASAFPPEYNEKSTIIKDIQPGQNTIDFDVQTKRPGKDSK